MCGIVGERERGTAVGAAGASIAASIAMSPPTGKKYLRMRHRPPLLNLLRW